MNSTPCCHLCSASQSRLFRCGGCKVVHYCSQEHQVSDRSHHKSACNVIKTCSARLDVEEQKLRNQPDDGDMFAPPRVFEEHVGRFWGLLHTRPYMRARYALTEAILKVQTHHAVVAALDHATGCIRLCRSDNMGVRYLVTTLLLRLGRDQECYDFVKWYATTGSKGDYDWGNLDEPFLDVKDARSSDGWKKLLKSSPTFNQIVEDRAVRNATGGLETEPVEEVTKIVKSHVKMLYQAVEKANVHFWPALLHPGRHLDARPPYYSSGTKEEMQMVLKNCYDAWNESPGAIEVIKAIFHKNDY